jgi:glycolate oxidase iron-sulfur subunit
MLAIQEYAGAIDKCSHCGYCQATCPVFLEDMLENHLARARINLINEIFIKKSMPLSARAREIINRCLLCTNCTQTCSSQVPCDEIITAARIEAAKEPTGVGGSIKKFVIRRVLNQRGLAGVLSKAGSLAQKLNLSSLEVPPLASQTFDRMYSGQIGPQGEPRARAAYFVGCGTNFLYPDTGQAVVKVLTQNGVEVNIPRGIVCCGIPALAEGDLEAAQDSVRTNVEILAALDVDAIVTDCTSCGMAFKVKAAKVFPADDPIQEKIKAVADKIVEVSEYLNRLGLSAQPESLVKSYTYHVPCHRSWSPTVINAPRQLLSQIPGATLLEMEEPGRCCGAAGTFYLENRELSEGIRSHKLSDIRQTGAEAVVTQCPVCRFYLAVQLKDMEVMHPVTMLAHAYGS